MPHIQRRRHDASALLKYRLVYTLRAILESVVTMCHQLVVPRVVTEIETYNRV